MRSMFTRAKIGVVALGLAAVSLPLLVPAPASAWGYHRGWAWRAGYGWHPGWAYAWHRGCCYGPGPIIRVRPTVIAVPPPPLVVGPVWVRPHWQRGYWVPGHWR